jgi:hypothetical protein
MWNILSCCLHKVMVAHLYSLAAAVAEHLLNFRLQMGVFRCN